MPSLPAHASELLKDLLPASAGAGKYLQRDYWAVIADCRLSPSSLMTAVRKRFWEFAPAESVRFARLDGSLEELRKADEMVVNISLAGQCRVRVMHSDSQTLTLATLRGHPEAGVITFGAYRNDYRDVIFHIRSRARSGTALLYAGFLAAGEPLQTNTWIDFVSAVAFTFGSGVVGYIHVDTRTLPLRFDERSASSPTFKAEGD